MLRKSFAVCVVVLAGCACNQEIKHERPIGTSEPWDTTYLIDLSPDSVSIADLTSHATTLGEHYWEHAQMECVCWPPYRSSASLEKPDRYIDGADSGIFSGYALAAFAFKFGATKADGDLARFEMALRGVHLLTNITGTPGVICRCAFPAHLAGKFGYPGEWEGRIEDGFVHEGPDDIEDVILGGSYPRMIYYTRATKDQLTGILFGLAAAWHVLSRIGEDHQCFAVDTQRLIAKIVSDICGHLEKYDWRIRDERGKNKTNADKVDGLLKLQALALLRYTSGSSQHLKPYEDQFGDVIQDAWFDEMFNCFANWDDYYAWNLRVARSLSVWLLEQEESWRSKISSFANKRWWPFVRAHQSAWFSFSHAVMNENRSDEAGVRSLKCLSLKPIRMWSSPYWGQEQAPGFFGALWNCTGPYVVSPRLRKPTSYFTWEKAAWDVGEFLDKEGRGDSVGLGFLLPYWMGRYFDLIRPE